MSWGLGLGLGLLVASSSAHAGTPEGPEPEASPAIATVEVDLSVRRGPADVQLFEVVERPRLFSLRPRPENAGRYRVLCTAPCQQPVTLRHTGKVVVGGHDGINRSRPLDLSEAQGRVELDAVAGRRGLQIVGSGFLATGFLLVVFGLLPYGLDGSAESKSKANIVIGVGAGSFVLGGTLLVFSASQLRFARKGEVGRQVAPSAPR